MPPRPLSSKEVIKVLLREGFVFVSQKGSHQKYKKSFSGQMIVVIVPSGKREIPTGTLRSIIRQSRLVPETFFTA